MRLIRAILVVMLAFSVATLPAVGGIALAPSAHASTPGSVHAHHSALAAADVSASNCCEGANHCDKEPARDCACDAACLLTCLSMTGALAPSSTVSLPLAKAVVFAVPAESFRSNASHPPLPPPRL